MSSSPAHVTISWVFFILIGMVLCYSYFFYPNSHPIDCLIKARTGHDCPSCGFSRAFSYFSHLQFEEGMKFNSRAYSAFIFLLAQFLFRFIVIISYFLSKKQFSSLLVKCDVIVSISGFLFAFLPLLILK
jgi:hypothetical protein